MSVYPLGNKVDLYNYLITSQWDAGEFLNERANPEALKKAKDNDNINAQMRPTIINYTDNRTIWDWSSHTTHLASLAASGSKSSEEPLSTAEKKKKEEESKARRNGIIATLLIVGFTFITRYTYKGYIRQQQNFNYTEGFLSKIREMPESNDEKNALKNSLSNLVACQHRIDSLILARFKHASRASLGGLCSGLVIGLGGFIVDSRVSKLGYVGLVASTAYAAWIYADYITDSKEIRHLFECIAGDKTTHMGWANQILSQQLHKFDENMEVIQMAPQPIYQPLYPASYISIHSSQLPPSPSAPPL